MHAPRALPAAFLLCCLFPFSAFALELHVSPQGNDAWSGRYVQPNAAKTDGPLASLEGARRAVRALPRPLAEPVRVLFAGGVYRLAEAVSFDAGDSGEPQAPITYAARLAQR